MSTLKLQIFFGLIVLSARLHAVNPDDPAPQTWVATISVQEYTNFGKQMRLQFCDKDASAFVERMRRGHQVTADQTIEFRADALRETRLPTKANIEEGLANFLAKPGSQDTVFVFVSMHGTQHTGQGGGVGTYLLPSDFDSNDVEGTSIDVQWLRDRLQAGRAKTTVLILDACHSGGIQQTQDSQGLAKQRLKPLSIKSVRSVFEEPANSLDRRSIYVLSSCGPNESSMEVPDLKHGLFTYWLLCGLDGAADANDDAIITMDELFQFVEMHVAKTATYYRSPTGEAIEQHPERFLCGTDHGNVPVLALTPTSVSHALKSLADLVDGILRPHIPSIVQENRLARIGIVEFGVVNSQGDSELRGPLGSYGLISRQHLERNLIDMSSRLSRLSCNYRVIPEERLQIHLKNVELVEVNAGTIAEQGGSQLGAEVDALLIGTFMRRGNSSRDTGPDRLQLELRVHDLRNSLIVARISQTILVDEELWSMLGTSADRQQARLLFNHVAPPHRAEEAVQAVEQVPVHLVSAQIATAATVSEDSPPRINQIASAAEESILPHPLRDAGNTTISIAVLQGLPGQVPQKTTWLPEDPEQPNLLGFRTSKEMELTLKIRNNSNDWLAYIVQVDGLNQIGRSMMLPSESPYWLAPPKSIATVDQWLDTPSRHSRTPDGQHQQIAGTRLLVVSPPSSIAAQSRLTDQLGEIRVLVYKTAKLVHGVRGEQDPAASLGIGEGRGSLNTFPVYSDRRIDRSRLEATYVIRYAE